MMKFNFIRSLSNIEQQEVNLFGGKNTSLGHLTKTAQALHLNIPSGFALSTHAYKDHLSSHHLDQHIEDLVTLFRQHYKSNSSPHALEKISSRIRALIEAAPFSPELIEEVTQAYHELSRTNHTKNITVAVRSSATAEDLPHASFAGQQDSFLSISGVNNVLTAIKKCMASLFTTRALMYRYEHHYPEKNIAISVGVQVMIPADRSGTIFTCDTETGFPGIIIINSSYGMGELLVKGEITPDEFHVHKETFKKGYASLIKKGMGDKKYRITSTGKRVPTQLSQRTRFSLNEKQIRALAQAGISIEQEYKRPMDIEWAYDKKTKKLYIVQARPITAIPTQQESLIEAHTHDQTEKTALTKPIVTGQSVGTKTVSGTARIITSLNNSSSFHEGDILITSMTTPDWLPLIKKAGALVTDSGGRTCHAALVSRELGIPALVGTKEATRLIKTGAFITVDCSRGSTGAVYRSSKNNMTVVKKKTAPLKNYKNVWLTIGQPDKAYQLASLPVQGVGLARIEFIIGSEIGIHPMACCQPHKLDSQTKKTISTRAREHGYHSAQDFFIGTLAHGIARIAASFYPRPVIVRFSDFKSNEYRQLVGGSFFEPHEENPLLGLRGASRYTNELYAPAFKLECAALKKARSMGFTNIKLMIPFVRTVQEAHAVTSLLTKNGLKRSSHLEYIMMCELPSNVVSFASFCPLFDGFSIGSNDLTQLTLGVDRDSALLAPLFDERTPEVKEMIGLAITYACKNKKTIGICGQAPSDYPELISWLFKQGISYISLTEDSL